MKEKRWCNEDGKEEKSADKREKTKCKQKKKNATDEKKR